jgi:cell wall-associated NlpC family hydrolase
MTRFNYITAITKKHQRQALMVTVLFMFSSMNLYAQPSYAVSIQPQIFIPELETQSFTVDDYPTNPAQIIVRGEYMVEKISKNNLSTYSEEIIKYARGFVDKVPYAKGGTNPEMGFDCSGLLQYVYKQVAGIDLPHSADSQAAMSTIISKKEARAGDWVWWPGEHIGIYSENGMMIHAPNSGLMVTEKKIWGEPIYLRFGS